MKCPIDDAQLVMTERAGIEIDYCPQCRGVWLDRGEIDKIVERSIVNQPFQAEPTDYRSNGNRPREGDHGSSHGQGHGGYSDGRKRKRQGWLGELFD